MGMLKNKNDELVDAADVSEVITRCGGSASKNTIVSYLKISEKRAGEIIADATRGGNSARVYKETSGMYRNRR